MKKNRKNFCFIAQVEHGNVTGFSYLPQEAVELAGMLQKRNGYTHHGQPFSFEEKIDDLKRSSGPHTTLSFQLVRPAPAGPKQEYIICFEGSETTDSSFDIDPWWMQ